MNLISGSYKKINTLSTILGLLKVKHTNSYTNQHFNEHPNKYDMFGLSRMLSHFGIKNKGIKVIDKENDIHALESPFIAHVGNDFVVVEAIKNDKIVYHWNQQKLSVPLDEFNKIWSGAILIAEVDDNSIEPHYNDNRKQELIVNTLKHLLLLGVLTLAIIGIIQNGIYKSVGAFLFLAFNLTGIYVSYLLVLKQMNIQSNHADKICSLFSQSDCNNVLDSPAAKFLGIVGWSELGFSYFLSNTFIILFIPHLLHYVVLINVCALPYSLWSVWYQKFKAKTWCPLCLIVQALFWALFITSVLFGYIQIPAFIIMDILSIGLVYGLPFIIIYLLLPQLTQGHRAERVVQEYNRFKMDNNIFKGQLKQQAHYQVDKSNYNILLGNPDSENLITIFTNPHCGPCASMHARVENLLERNSHKFCVQYVLSSFNDELNSSCDFFFFVNENFSTEERDSIYGEWFTEGKINRESMFKKYDFTPNGTISGEYQKHLDWKESSKLRATPTILINGFKLPENYKIEDLAYFTDLGIDSK